MTFARNTYTQSQPFTRWQCGRDTLACWVCSVCNNTWACAFKSYSPEGPHLHWYEYVWINVMACLAGYSWSKIGWAVGFKCKDLYTCMPETHVHVHLFKHHEGCCAYFDVRTGFVLDGFVESICVGPSQLFPQIILSFPVSGHGRKCCSEPAAV